MFSRTIPYALRFLCGILLVSVLGMTGCGNAAAQNGIIGGGLQKDAMQERAEILYELPTYKPGIWPDLSGYASGEEKRAMLQEPSGEFSVRSAESGEEVYRGESRQGFAYFTQVKKSGTYYLETDTYGQSAYFEISETHYADAFLQVYDTYIAKSEEITPQDIIALLQAYEWMPDAFALAKENGMPDVPEYVQTYIASKDLAEVADAEKGLYAVLLSKFAYTIRVQDTNLATTCLQKASSLLGEAQQDDAIHFRGICEVYRLTQEDGLRAQIDSYEELFRNRSVLSDRDYIYGAMTYMSTRGPITKHVCDTMMDVIAKRAEEIIGDAADFGYTRTAQMEAASYTQKLQEMICANYVLGGYQSNGVISNYLHALSGVNAAGENYWGEAALSDAVMVYAWMAQLEQNEKLWLGFARQ